MQLEPANTEALMTQKISKAANTSQDISVCNSYAQLDWVLDRIDLATCSEECHGFYNYINCNSKFAGETVHSKDKEFIKIVKHTLPKIIWTTEENLLEFNMLIMLFNRYYLYFMFIISVNFVWTKQYFLLLAFKCAF